jgi:hypothetical protein
MTLELTTGELEIIKSIFRSVDDEFGLTEEEVELYEKILKLKKG